MNSPRPYSALREWRHHMAAPVRVAALCGVAAILALIGPFETAEVMRPLPRLIYWLTIAWLTYSTGYAAHEFAVRATPKPPGRRIAIAGALTGLGVWGIVYLLNGLVFGAWPGGRAFWEFGATAMGIAIIIATIFQIAHAPGPPGQAHTQAHARAQTPQPPPLMDRLPLEKRAPLVAISVEDHYVRVRTTKGEEMLLMRLADAIREAGADAGLQVHRSHWIAPGQVVSVTRRGDGALLVMTHGADIPVSRAHMPKIKEAGLLPQ